MHLLSKVRVIQPVGAYIICILMARWERVGLLNKSLSCIVTSLQMGFGSSVDLDTRFNSTEHWESCNDQFQSRKQRGLRLESGFQIPV